MLIIKRIHCRVFQLCFRAVLPVLPYREPEILTQCEALGEVCEKENISSILIVTDSGIVEHQLLEPILEQLTAHQVEFAVYDKTRPNPTVENVEEALALYKEKQCGAIIAVGGGSSMDCAKAVGARVAYPKRSVGQMKGILRVLRKIPTLIAVPTTAGTGSEVTLAAVITDSEKHHKYALMSFPLIPHYALLDARFTLSLPKSLTATTGMDALTHAVEAYIGRSTTKETRTLALEAAKLVFENIKVAYEDGNNQEARSNMLYAAYKAGVAFSKSYVGYIHAIAHSLGGQYGIPHGLANAVIMPYVLVGYGKSVYKKLHRMATYVGISTEQEEDEAAARRFIEAIREYNSCMGIPKKLKGICVEDIEVMAEHAQKEANPLYPVPRLMTKEELKEYYYRIMEKEGAE